jgi:hypothetical protein
MLPNELRDIGQNDFFKARLDQIVDMNHALARLARQVDWGFLETDLELLTPMFRDARRCRRG